MRGSLRSVGTLVLAGGVVASASLATSPAAHAVNPSCDALTISTAGTSSCDVPAGVTQLDVVALGAGGGGSQATVNSRGGHGAQVTLRLTVTPGETLTIEVGQGGQVSASQYDGAGGGGWTVVKRGATVLLVAAGGGGAGSWVGPANGGDAATGGTVNGGDGQTANANVQAGFGATAAAGGAAGLCTSGCAGPSYNGFAGTSGTGGNGGNTLGSGRPIGANGWQRGTAGTQGQNYVATGGSGGAGYFGGGGGAGVGYNAAGGGGAGSSFPASGATYATASNGGAPGSNGGTGSISLAAYTPPAPPTPPSPGGGGATTPVTVTINLSTNGGTGSVDAMSGDQGTWATVPSGAGLSRSGYLFAGWNTAADGSGTSFAPGSSLQLNGDNTLYAQWKVDAASSTGVGSGSESGSSLSPTPASLQPGRSQLLVNGAAAPVTVKPNQAVVRQSTGLVIEGDGFTMSLAGRGDASDPLGLTPKQALVLQSAPAQTMRSRALLALRAKVRPVAESSGTGFKANSEVKLYLLADTYLGSIMTDAAGSYKGSVPIPDGITPGNYVLQVNGFAPSGVVRSLSIGVVVEAQPKALRATTASQSVYFDSMSARLTDSGKASLRALVKKTGTSVTNVRCVGFVQPTGGTANDESLSTARARNVAAYLRSLGLKGAYAVRGDGRDGATGAKGRRVDVTVTYSR